MAQKPWASYFERVMTVVLGSGEDSKAEPSFFQNAPYLPNVLESK